MRAIASTGNDVRALPIWVHTPFGRDDVLWGIWLDHPADNRVIIRDVALFASDITYGDIISVKEVDGKFYLNDHLESSDWTGYVVVTRDEAAAAVIGEALLDYPPLYNIAGRFAPGASAPILGLASGSAGNEQIQRDLTQWQNQGLIIEYAKTTQR